MQREVPLAILGPMQKTAKIQEENKKKCNFFFPRLKYNFKRLNYNLTLLESLLIH